MKKSFVCVAPKNCSLGHAQRLRLMCMCAMVGLWLTLSALLAHVTQAQELSNLLPADVQNGGPEIYSEWPFDAKEAKRRQENVAEALGSPVTIANSIGMELRVIPAGEFMMGLPENEEVPSQQYVLGYPDLHRVRITRPFYFGMHEVTVGQFRQFVNATGYTTEPEKDGKGGFGWTGTPTFAQSTSFNWRNMGWKQADEHPVSNLTWDDMAAFCKWLSDKEAVTYRLPTEAEWEYACRAGTATRYCFGDEPEQLVQFANVADRTFWRTRTRRSRGPSITASDGYEFTAPVGRFQANAFGLHDMHGNVAEVCADWWKDKAYADSPLDDSTGPSEGSYRVMRGGTWIDSGYNNKSWARYAFFPSSATFKAGFRVIRSLPAE